MFLQICVSERLETSSVNFCEKHPDKAVRYYCNPCSSAICEVCWDEDHEDWNSHGVSTMNVYLKLQQQVPSRISDYRKECERLSSLLQEWPVVVTQIGAVERKQESILRNRSARTIEEMSIDVRNSLKCQMADVQNFKGKILEQFKEIERSFEGIFGDAVTISEDESSTSFSVGVRGQVVAEGSSSSSGASVGGSITSGALRRNKVGSCSSEKELTGGGAVGKKDEKKDAEREKRVLIGVEMMGKMGDLFECSRAVYNWETREVMCLDYIVCSAIRVFGVNEANDKLEVKRTMEWEGVARIEDIWDICMDEVNNTMYGVVAKEGFNRVEELDQWSLKKKGESSNSELDTRGLLNNAHWYHWHLALKRDTIVLAVEGVLGMSRGWTSVVIYRNSVRIREHTLAHLGIYVSGGVRRPGCVLVNETTLLLSCGTCSNKVAVVSLPPHSHHNRTSASSSSPFSSANSTVNVKYLIATGVDRVYSFVWTPSGEELQGYLWVGDFKNKKTLVFKVDLETDLKNVEAGKETQLQQVHNILPSEKGIIPLSPTDDSTIFALEYAEEQWSGQPVLLKLMFSST